MSGGSTVTRVSGAQSRSATVLLETTGAIGKTQLLMLNIFAES